jgi:hypothetical protein
MTLKLTKYILDMIYRINWIIKFSLIFLKKS